MSKTTWLITGASSGLGYELAQYALSAGDQVVLAAPSLAPMQQLAAAHPETALVVGLDVTVAEQRANVVEQAERRFGAIDILVNNAGIDYLGAIEEQREADYRRIFDVNFFGAVALLQLVLPGMRKRGSGLIANMSSMDGLASLAGNGYYSASKFALEGVTEALWQELEPLGLKAVLIEPGSFRTGIDTRTHFSGELIPDYDATSGSFYRAMQNVESLMDVMFPGDPKLAAAGIFATLKADPKMHRIILGADAYSRIGEKIKDLQSDYEASRELAHSTNFAK